VEKRELSKFDFEMIDDALEALLKRPPNSLPCAGSLFPAALVDQQQEVPMTVKIDSTEPNVFPAVEGVDVHDAGRNAEVILGTEIEGELIPVTIKLSYEQAEALADLLEPFRKS
jgi:hypothetical protein